MAVVPEEHLVATGAKRDVAFAQWLGTARTISEWESLDWKVRTKFRAQRFDPLCANGKLPVPEQIRPLRNKIWEFKIKKPAWRIAAFQDGRCWCLTHLFMKPFSKKKLATEINKAIGAMDEHMDRTRDEPTGHTGRAKRKRRRRK